MRLGHNGRMIHWLMQILPTSLLFALPLAAPVPMHKQVYGELNGAGEVVVLLPGMRDDMRDFASHGFIRAAQAAIQRHDLALVAAGATLGYYKQRNLEVRLQEDVFAQLPEHPVSLLGISLGGFGALNHVRRYPQQVQRLWLLSPFLGDADFVQRLRSEGLAARKGDGDLEQALLANWQWLLHPPAGLDIWLGYGSKDDFAPAYQLLAEWAPDIPQVRIDGGHDWATWLQLWRQLLAGALAQPGSFEPVTATQPAQP